jgi:hypothetical protein
MSVDWLFFISTLHYPQHPIPYSISHSIFKLSFFPHLHLSFIQSPHVLLRQTWAVNTTGNVCSRAITTSAAHKTHPHDHHDHRSHHLHRPRLIKATQHRLFNQVQPDRLGGLLAWWSRQAGAGARSNSQRTSTPNARTCAAPSRAARTIASTSSLASTQA